MIGSRDHIIPSGFVTDFKHEKGVCEFAIDWYANGMPESLALMLGDRLFRVALPKDFPTNSVEMKAIDAPVYDEPQAFKLVSQENNIPNFVQLELDLSAVTVPIRLSCNGILLLSGWGKDDEWELISDHRGTFADEDPNSPLHLPPFPDPNELPAPYREWGFPLRVRSLRGMGTVSRYLRTLTGKEKEIFKGGECRPNGIWHSILVGRDEQNPQLIRTTIDSSGPTVIKKEHFRRFIEFHWNNYQCVAGKWTMKDTSHDLTDQTWVIKTEMV